ncbi:MAG: hypothetical protein DRP74_04810 [Candidatus Omnitrophota bacterium]|nr:MAG: hypothetical protein DRP74_04810 [Candidatus Omnitrophota bacterium]
MRIKLTLILLFFTGLISFPGTLLYGKLDWQEHSTAHFIIYYQKDIAEEYIEQVAEKAEEYYYAIADNLSFKRHDAWTWDNRAKIYIFKDKEQLEQETGKRRWHGGTVAIRKKIIKTYPWAEGFFDRLLPHELGHIMFHELVGFRNNIPLWLDEGVAMMQEKKDMETYSLLFRDLLKTSHPIPIEKLHVITPRTLIVPEIFYCQSASIVDFLLTQFEKKDFFRFSKYLKSGKSAKEALAEVYDFDDLGQLQEAWLRYLDDLG